MFLTFLFPTQHHNLFMTRRGDKGGQSRTISVPSLVHQLSSQLIATTTSSAIIATTTPAILLWPLHYHYHLLLLQLVLWLAQSLLPQLCCHLPSKHKLLLLAAPQRAIAAFASTTTAIASTVFAIATANTATGTCYLPKISDTTKDHSYCCHDSYHYHHDNHILATRY